MVDLSKEDVGCWILLTEPHSLVPILARVVGTRTTPMLTYATQSTRNTPLWSVHTGGWISLSKKIGRGVIAQKYTLGSHKLKQSEGCGG